jgi:hypothetical protein
MSDELNEVGGAAENQIPQEILDEATSGGWKPQEDYHGKGEWVDAETFVKRGREILPLLNKNNDRLKKEIDSLRNELTESKLGVKKLQEYHAQVEQKAYDRALKDLKLQRRGAMQAGDTVAALDIEEEIADLEKSKPVVEVAAPAKAETPAIDPILTDWIEENKDWYSTKNEEMMDYANAVSLRLRRNDPNNELTGRQFLNEVKKAVKKGFPDFFGKPVSAVEGGSNGSTRSSGQGSRLADLPSEARAAYKELAKEDWYQDLAKSQKITTEQLYLQDYQ